VEGKYVRLQWSHPVQGLLGGTCQLPLEALGGSGHRKRDGLVVYREVEGLQEMQDSQ
jgi:hypothetical protein